MTLTETLTLGNGTWLSSPMTASSGSLTIGSSGNWPTSPTTQFRVLVDQEIVVLQGGPFPTYTVVSRASDGTTAAAHNGSGLAGAAVAEVLTPTGLTNIIVQLVGSSVLNPVDTVSPLLALIFIALQKLNQT